MKKTGRQNCRRIGAQQEEAAGIYLENQGYRLFRRNFRCRIGEIDLIATDKDTVVFIEVKYRRNGHAGDPLEAVTAAKQRTICRMADIFLARFPSMAGRPCRFDVLAISGGTFRLVKNAFDYRV